MPANTLNRLAVVGVGEAVDEGVAEDDGRRATLDDAVEGIWLLAAFNFNHNLRRSQATATTHMWTHHA